jgi:starch phosphorylase
MTITVNTGTFLYQPVGLDSAAIQRSIANRLLYSIGKDPQLALEHDWMMALAEVVRDGLVERWMETTRRQHQQDVKRVYYLSVEFLLGRALSNSLLALGHYDEFREALAGTSLDLEEAATREPEPALGNGGLGRLAACFLDSMATLGLPGFGYGIRYEYGMFAQRIIDGHQVEVPDHWLAAGNPWEFPRPEILYPIRFGGQVRGANGSAEWIENERVLAMAYDMLVPGFGVRTVNTMRLWSAKATEELALGAFNEGDYTRAVEDKNRSENVSRVLYPDDSTPQGRELRLRQEYFFVSASLQDILHRHRHRHGSLAGLAEKVAIHLNDTHPALAVPELMRLLVDEHRLDWDAAWDQCTRIFSYTNHTLLPEALETWPVDLIGTVLPRHLQIILEINERLLLAVHRDHGGDNELTRRVSLIDEDNGRRVRMAHLSIVASRRVNGVSKLHSRLMQETIFADFARLFPGRFVNVTNGVTQRRWLSQANPALAHVLDQRIGPDWRRDLDRLAALRPLADDPEVRAAFRAAKEVSKRRLAAFVAQETGVAIDPATMFDMQIKRIHEYKRQLLNLLHVVTRYNRIAADPSGEWVPRTVLFAGKAASAYRMAKLIIKLISDVADVVNADARTNHLFRVAFVPNYCVSVAERMIPAADLSEQISTAGFEASGTGNMKLALNGALTIGTEDGANIEIRDEIGADDIFIFGLSAGEVRARRAAGYEPAQYYESDEELRRALDQIGSGFFSPAEPERYRPIVDALLRHGDYFMLLADYRSYLDCQARVDALWRQPGEWTRRAIRNVAGMGPFSSDRAIRGYADGIWQIEPVASGPE